ncbi:Aminotransferase class I and II [Fragilaria crotonensis]|nr:Aminotransferase class I and II [Fragilaria crotonensis]
MKFSSLAFLSLLVSASAFVAPLSPSQASLSFADSACFATAVQRNPNFAKLAGGYLFPEIGRRRNAYLADHPEMADRIISLGIGDTTMPIPEHILNGLVSGASKLGTKEGYSGYGAEQGMGNLREKIASTLYNGLIQADEVFVSDGAKCDIMRLQQVFGTNVVTAVQDPSYPVYVDTSVMMGQTGTQNPDTQQYENIVYMPCTAENGFFPDYASLPRADIQPTGAAATKDQLEDLIRLCKDRGSILVFDAAYAPFIRTPGIPKSIFECEGARDVAIEVNSFSKYAGFTGVRLGWTVVPSTLLYQDGTPVRQDFNRVMTTAFNGASNIVQNGGLACLDPEGLDEINALIDYYLENASILKETMEAIPGFSVYGGTDAPYIFVKIPDSMGGSWNAFSTILEKAQVVTIPGAGFGPGGEGYLRLSAFAPRASILEACERLKVALA